MAALIVFPPYNRYLIVTGHILYATNVLQADVYQYKTKLPESTQYSIQKRKLRQLGESVDVVHEQMTFSFEVSDYRNRFNFELTDVVDV